MNTPTKQTVYLPVKIDDEFWTKWDNGKKPDYDLADVETGENTESWVNEKEGYFFTPEQLNEYTQGVIKQALETAAENATIEHKEYQVNGEYNSQNLGQEVCIDAEEPYRNYVSIDKASITNTFEETFKKFEV